MFCKEVAKSMTIEQQRVTINLSENDQLFTKHDTWPKFAAQ